MANFNRYYFLGIGGIGMSALARYFKKKGFDVAGYDRQITPLTQKIEQEGIEVFYDESVDLIPEKFTRSADSTLVVVTPAIPDTHPQLVFFRKNNYTIHKRSEVLGEITRQKKALCIAGTHGKTSTSVILSHLLYPSHVSCNAFLGGIANNYKTNFLTSKDSNLVVVEADEYDRSFHQLSPYMAVITSLDADHLDIYNSHEEFKQGFEQFANSVATGGALLIRKGLELNLELQKGVKQYSYSLNEGGDFYADNIRIEDNKIYFDFVYPNGVISELALSIPILINVENCVAAIALAWLNGVKKEEIRFGIESFSGIYRRFNFVYQSDKTVYIDDYAHHPSELEASISSIRKLYPERKLTGVFQPHLYSRTRDFVDGFARALTLLDELILLPIYPAREEAIEGVSSKIIFDKLSLEDKQLCDKENLLSLLASKQLDVLITLGAGDIDQFVPQIKELLKEKEAK